VHDWPQQGVCCSPLVDGDRLWYVSNRGEVVCLDTEGFRDGENDGPFKDEKPKPQQGKPEVIWDEKLEADVIWKFNMMNELQVSQHNMCNCSVTCSGNLLFVNTSNGVDEGHINIPQADAPSFLCLDRQNGKVLWTDNLPGGNVLHGQWSSPAYGVLGGVPQVLFGGGDGWLYSFDPKGDGNGKSKLLWKFDCNPKDSKYSLGGRATRNHLIGTPVIYDDLVYIGVGEDPEHGEGVGHLWCIDPTKRGDVSPELVYNKKDPTKIVPPKRLQAAVKEDGDFTKPNPNSAAVWHYGTYDANKNGKIEFEETMHRTLGTVAIKDDILYVADFSGLVHCVNAKTGVPYWTHDMLAASWGSPLVVEGHVYIGDEDGDITVFDHGKEKNIVSEFSMVNSVYSTPIVANNTLFVCNKDQLFSVAEGASSKPAKSKAASSAEAE
jgi:outer membrane protein assembly factor BamB